MVQVSREDLETRAAELGIEGVDDMTVAALKKAIKDKEKEDLDIDEGRDEETGDERVERKTKEAKKGPIAKPRRELVRPNIGSLYPWAVNRGKAERAHNAVFVELAEQKMQVTNPDGPRYISEEDVEQKVMDNYTLHGGLVRDQEKATTIGRRKPIKPGATTDEIVHDELGGSADDEDTDSDD